MSWNIWKSHDTLKHLKMKWIHLHPGVLRYSSKILKNHGICNEEETAYVEWVKPAFLLGNLDNHCYVRHSGESVTSGLLLLHLLLLCLIVWLKEFCFPLFKSWYERKKSNEFGSCYLLLGVEDSLKSEREYTKNFHGVQSKWALRGLWLYLEEWRKKNKWRRALKVKSRLS